jgi:two-component system response regulator
MTHSKDVIEILIVEDDPFQAELCISALEENNVTNTIIHLKNGEVALEYINSNDKPKVMFLDLRMPGMDGFDVLRAIKSDEKTSEIPVIVFTSSTSTSDKRECYSLGAKDYIIKPSEIESYKHITYQSINSLLAYSSQILI